MSTSLVCQGTGGKRPPVIGSRLSNLSVQGDQSATTELNLVGATGRQLRRQERRVPVRKGTGRDHTAVNTLYKLCKVRRRRRCRRCWKNDLDHLPQRPVQGRRRCQRRPTEGTRGCVREALKLVPTHGTIRVTTWGHHGPGHHLFANGTGHAFTELILEGVHFSAGFDAGIYIHLASPRQMLHLLLLFLLLYALVHVWRELQDLRRVMEELRDRVRPPRSKFSKRRNRRFVRSD